MDRHEKAFTLVELMVGLMVTSVILSAIATLAFALNKGSTVGSDYASTQAQIRRATVYVSDLVSRCSLICAAPGNDLAIWRSDDNGDGQINLNELVYLERGPNRGYLRLCTFTSAANPKIDLSVLGVSTTKSQYLSVYGGSSTPLIPMCNDAQFLFLDATPPKTGLLGITFGFKENGVFRPYNMVVAARCRAAHLLNAAGSELVAKDDD
jgi:prepilin-type N-terminal cleavage/methylation domain-containing protein